MFVMYFEEFLFCKKIGGNYNSILIWKKERCRISGTCDSVKAGTPIIKIYMELIKKKEIDIITLIVIINRLEYQF